MESHTFTKNDLVPVALVPPAGATGLIIRAHVKRGPVEPGTAVRLFHLRTKNSHRRPKVDADAVLPRESEILELLCRNDQLTAAFSGYGNKRIGQDAGKEGREVSQPIHMGKCPEEFDVVITAPFNGEGATVSAGPFTATSDTEIDPNPGEELELLLGMNTPDAKDLRAPEGWTISWGENAVEWIGAPKEGG